MEGSARDGGRVDKTAVDPGAEGHLDARLARIERALEAQARASAEIAEALRLLRVPLPEPLMTVSEVAERLALSPKAVQRMIRAGELTAIVMRCGGRKLYRVKPDDLRAFYDRMKSPRQSDGGDDDRIIMVPV